MVRLSRCSTVAIVLKVILFFFFFSNDNSLLEYGTQILSMGAREDCCGTDANNRAFNFTV